MAPSNSQIFAEFVASHLELPAESRKKHNKHNTKVITSSKSSKTEAVRFRKRRCDGLQTNSGGKVATSWSCCGMTFSELLAIHKHVALEHQSEIEQLTEARLCQIQESSCGLQSECVGDREKRSTSGGKQARLSAGITWENHPSKNTCKEYKNTHVFPWLPNEEDCSQGHDDEWEILLFYKYVDIEDPIDICEWQKELCRRLKLTGKIRIASEGINGTVGGKKSSTGLYMRAVQCHPLFQQIDFKTSKGSGDEFHNGLQVGVHSEIVPMGVSPATLSYNQAGCHLEVDEFHNELDTHLSRKTSDDDKDDTVFVDCRNFYESRIGQFPGALTPNIRKFSYWPEYIDENIKKFEDKRVIMYCTGGIRCERGSAYLKSKGVCKDVLQLKGGIHRYMEKYPNGFFMGKLFVFDDRYSIASNDTVISSCFYCNKPCDNYQPCTSPHCHQLVLSCPQCRGHGSTACCQSCKQIAEKAEIDGQKAREECECTRRRVRIPQETMKDSASGLDASNVGQKKT